MTLHGRAGARRVQAVLDTGDPGAVTIGGALARIGEPLGPVTIMESGTGPHRVCPVWFDSVAAIGARWEGAVVNANLDRCDGNANIGVGFFDGARGFILDPESQSLTVLTGASRPLERASQDQEWSWTPWRPDLTVRRTREVEGRGLTLETEWSGEANRPIVVAWIHGEPVPCIVDTGAAIGLVLRNAAPFDGPSRPARLSGHGGTVRGRAWRIDGVELAGRQFGDVKVFVADQPAPSEAGGETYGVIGMGLLGRQPVWFDLEGRRLGLGAPAR